MKSESPRTPAFDIASTILTVRGENVLLDMDLARIYGVPTKRLNEQVKRNLARFPDDFAFQLTPAEKAEVVANCDHLRRLKFSPVLPYAFTEQGAIVDVLQRLMRLLDPPPEPESPRQQIGFHVVESEICSTLSRNGVKRRRCANP